MYWVNAGGNVRQSLPAWGHFMPTRCENRVGRERRTYAGGFRDGSKGVAPLGVCGGSQ
jgi:hypothetical protein